MTHRSHFGVFVTLMVALGALAAAAPVSAESVEKSCRKGPSNSAAGTCGTWQVHDQDTGGTQDATCVYATGSRELDKLTLKAPKLFGHYATKTNVAYRMIVRRSSAEHE